MRVHGVQGWWIRGRAGSCRARVSGTLVIRLADARTAAAKEPHKTHQEAQRRMERDAPPAPVASSICASPTGKGGT